MKSRVKTDRLVIIPAAGLGMRVGSPPAKELFIHPRSEKTLISHAIDLAHEWQAHALVISRKDKSALNDFIRAHYQEEVTLLELEQTQEWTDSVDQSKKLWRQKNILLLPDSDFSPSMIGETMFEAMSTVSFVAAGFLVDEGKDWGVIEEFKDGLYVAEKPQYKKAHAWGLLGFLKEEGQKFFTEYKRSSQTHEFVYASQNYQIFSLDFYKDLTRG